MTPAVLDVVDIVYNYPAVSSPTLAGLDLRIAAGESVAIVGPSGSGKSTLLRLCGLLDHPETGEIRLAGERVTYSRERRRSRLRATTIGFVFQDFQLLRDRDALENVLLGAMYHPTLARREASQRSRELLDQVGLSHRVGAVPGKLSGGEQQRVAIARALVGDPALLICDEPTGNLDTPTAKEIRDVLLDLCSNRRMALLLATHDPATWSSVDRIYDLHDGRLHVHKPDAC